jgi:3-phosphoglycerate kinase
MLGVGTFFKETINSIDLRGQTVLLRTDYNVPLTADGKVADDFRIRAGLATIQQLLERGCKVVIISHLGRPDGRDMKFSLEPAAQRLAELLGEDVRFVDQAIGDKPKMAVKRAPKRSVIVLENLRFYPGEKANDPHFAKALAEASGARYFVQDGFGVVHRAHASTVAITHELPSVAGLLLEREYTAITQAMQSPKRPLATVLGGAKVKDKIALIQKFIEVADTIIVSGAMANNFLAYKGIPIGKSKFEPGLETTLDEIYETAKNKVGADSVDDFLVLPSDVVVAASPEDTPRTVAIRDVAPDDMILDMGTATMDYICERVQTAGTTIWNGTLGVAEKSAFAVGSARLAQTLASHPEVASIVGGGDTADFVIHWDRKKGSSFTHVSTGGGASLALMAGEKLPGVESLLDARG